MPVHISGQDTRISSTGNLTIESLLPRSSDSSIGSFRQPFKSIYVSSGSLYIGNSHITSDSGGLNLPTGSKIGGINPGTIKIKGTAASVSDLESQSHTTGDAFIIGDNLFVKVNNAFVDCGAI